MAEKSKQVFCLDASFALAFLLPDEQHSQVVKIFDQYSKGDCELISAPLILYEIANALNSAVKSRRITPEFATEALNLFQNLEIQQYPVDLQKALLIAHQSKLSVYDASYLYVSKTHRCQLLTFDQDLMKLSL